MKIKRLSLEVVSKCLLYLFFVFLPFQIKGVLYSANIYGLDFMNSYSTHFLYISDIFLILGLLVMASSIVFNPSKYGKFTLGDISLFSLILLLCSMVGISIAFSGDIVNSFGYFIRFIEFTVVYLIIVNKIVDIKAVMKIFVFVMLIAAFIGVFQYVYGHSLGFDFLGEPALDVNMKGVAKVELRDFSVLRAYATFPHPNVFAGYLVFAGFINLYLLIKEKIVEKKILLTLCMIVFLLAFLLTFSRVALMALVFGVVLYYVMSEKKISFKYLVFIGVCILFFVVVFNFFDVFSARLDVFNDLAFEERELFLNIGKGMFFDNPFGVGAGNFTYLMQDYTFEKLMPWQFQPVHNIFFLFMNEMGIQGILVFLGFFAYLFYILMACLKKEVDKNFVYILMVLWSFVIVGGFFDHYLISLYQGQALLFILAGFVGVCQSDVKNKSL